MCFLVQAAKDFAAEAAELSAALQKKEEEVRLTRATPTNTLFCQRVSWAAAHCPCAS